MAAKWQTTDPELVTGDKSFMGELTAEQISAVISEEYERDEEPAEMDQTSAEAFSREIDLLGLRMGLLSHGSDFLIENGAPEKIIEEYERNKWEAIAKKAAEQLNLPDYRPLILKATRTKEQEKVMADIAAREQISRLTVFLGSLYNKATVELMAELMAGLKMRTTDDLTGRNDWDDISSALAFLVRYFFVLHGRLRAEGVEEIDPASPCPGEIPERYAEELRGIMRALLTYRAKHGGGFRENIAPCFHLEKVSAAQALEPITEITQKDLFGLPLSKIWRQQGAIAKQGRVGKQPGHDVEGLPVNVGAKTVKGEVLAYAEISDLEGKPIEIDEVCKGVERAVANLIYEAGGPAALPIRITPQQIYRAYARLPHDATVTDQQAEEMERAMDKLMFAPAQLDYTAQLERHTRTKQQDDFDYDIASGKRKQTLIVATKDEFTLRGQRVVGYEVQKVPLLYWYSHGFGQIAWTPNQLLTGPERPAVKETKEKSSQNNARNVAMKENILTRVYRMEQRSKAHKSYTALIRISEVAEDVFPDGLQGLTERGKRTLRKNMSQYLEFLQAEGKIRGFEETKERREVVGYTVKL